MKQQNTTADLVAQFLAQGKTVTVVAAGLVAIESKTELYRAMREGGRVAADSVREARAAESLHHTQIDAYTAAKADGWSTAAAQDYAQNAKV